MKGPSLVFSECLLHSRCCPGVNAHLPVGGCWKRKLGCEESTALRKAIMEVLSSHTGIGAPIHILPVEGKVGGVLVTLDGGSVSTMCVCKVGGESNRHWHCISVCGKRKNVQSGCHYLL